MGLSGMFVVVLLIGGVAFVGALALRAQPVAASGEVMGRSLARMNTGTLVAALAGLGFAMWAWVAFPTSYVNATEVPGLLAALGPILAGLVYLAVTAVAEVTWPRPTGSERAAFLTRRPLVTSAASWAMRALWAWAGLLGVLLVVFGVVAEPDGRSIATTGGERCLVNGVPVPCSGGATGPFPGWPYGGPILVATGVILVATLAVLHLVARRPAVWATSPGDDQLLRTISATRVVRGTQLALGTTLSGVLFFAGTTAANAGWWWGWPTLAAAVVVLGTSFGLAMRRMSR